MFKKILAALLCAATLAAMMPLTATAKKNAKAAMNKGLK